jgi:hypothetical protein
LDDGQNWHSSSTAFKYSIIENEDAKHPYSSPSEFLMLFGDARMDAETRTFLTPAGMHFQQKLVKPLYRVMQFRKLPEYLAELRGVFVARAQLLILATRTGKFFTILMDAAFFPEQDGWTTTRMGFVR